MLAATGINRAITKECWAACSPGYVCDHESGLCVPGECSPSCADTQVCTLVKQHLTCLDQAGTLTVPLDAGQMRRAPGAQASPGGKAQQHGSTRAVRFASPPAAPGASGCPTPGGADWYTRPGSEAGLEPPPPVHANWIGVWQSADPGTEKPMIVTQNWYGVDRWRARDYRVIESTGSTLTLSATPLGSPAVRVTVHFITPDRVKIGQIEYSRVDCTNVPSARAACCELPRAHWVRLEPKESF